MKVIQLHNNQKQLIAKAIQHNREAQHRLFERHASKMLSVCRYYVKNVSEAEEVMLNGFFKVFTHLASFKNQGSFEGWVRRIMVREAISYLRANKKVEFTSEVMDSKLSVRDSINSNIEVEELQQLIDELPEGYKMVFVMYAIEGYKHHEIADMLRISQGTSKSQLFKARQLLQKKFKQINKASYGAN